MRCIETPAGGPAWCKRAMKRRRRDSGQGTCQWSPVMLMVFNPPGRRELVARPVTLAHFVGWRLPRASAAPVLTYTAFTNYGLDRNCQPWGKDHAPTWLHPAQVLAAPSAACLDAPLFHDQFVAAQVFRIPVYHSFAHVPHVLDVHALARVERRLGPLLTRARANRLRDARTDLTLLLQFEAHVREGHLTFQRQRARWWAQHADDAAGQAALAAVEAAAPAWAVAEHSTVDWPGYMHEQFKFCPSPPGQPQAAASASVVQDFAAKMEQRWQQQQPVFFAIEDDLKTPSAACLAAYRHVLTAFFQRHWPVPAPWENPG